MQRTIVAALALLSSATAMQAQNTSATAVPVTVTNFTRAETDMYFGGMVKDGGFGKFTHRREPANIDKQDVIRMNRDTLYSPRGVRSRCRAGHSHHAGRGEAVHVDDDHRSGPLRAGGFLRCGLAHAHKGNIGTRYVVAAVRTLVDPADPKDVEQVHALQDKLKASQKDIGKFEVPNWDQASQKKVRDALLVLNTTISDFKNGFGARGKVDPIMHLIGTASGWGGNPDKDATYAMVTPAKNDGTTVYKLNVKNVPVDGFWSVSVYNEGGYFEKNPQNAYSLNNITAKKEADGSIAIQFGGCDGKIPNCIPIMKGWNAAVRLYRPRAEILSGKWKFPEPQPVN